MKSKIISLIRYVFIKIMHKFYFLGWPVKFARNIDFLNTDYIYIGNHTSIDSQCEIVVIKEHINEIDFQEAPVIKIGKRVGVGKGTLIYGAKSVNIEDYVMISPYCLISDYDHQYTNTDKPIVNQPLTKIQPVLIKEGSWIGSHTVILSGVTIGKNCVIGAGSVITKNIPDFSVAVGTPARVIKKYDPTTKTWKKLNK